MQTCTFETLYRGACGYVVRCRACNYYQIAAGTTCITIAAEDFNRLQKLTEDACRQVDDSKPPHVKGYAIGTPYCGVEFIFTASELLQFREMIDAAADEAKALYMMGLFEK
jgi:hypothetical protein